jgi:TatD DNase family protein
MLLVDTHTHLYADAFNADRAALLDAARAQGVGRFYLPNIDVDSIGPMLALEAAYPGVCIPMMGLHPCHVQQDWKAALGRVEEELQRRDWAAIGEIGIDLYWDKTFFPEQQQAFLQQVAWANERRLPVVIHSRESFAEIIQLLDRQPKQSPQGIFHCFTGTIEQARQAIDRGFYLGIGGVVTFKKSGLDAVVEQVPLEHLVLETDAPYLAPTPHRGKRNLPEYLRLVAEKIAEIKGVSIEEVAKVTTENAGRIFGA